MADDTTIDLDTRLWPPSLVACRKGVSIDAVQQAARRLGIQVEKTPTRRDAISFRDVVRLSKHFDSQ